MKIGNEISLLSRIYCTVKKIVLNMWYRLYTYYEIETSVFSNGLFVFYGY